MPKETDISILVVTHNHASFLPQLIASLASFGIKNVYFCEAYSSDHTLQILESSPYSANVLVKTTLEGFSKNNNDLIRHFNLKTPYFLLLNPDTYFEMDFIDILYKKSENDPTIAIAAPLLKYPDGTRQNTWKHFPNIITVIKKRLGLLSTKSEKQMIGPEIDWCLGACMLIRHTMIKKNQCLLDERYRLYCEDIDICFEAHAKGQKVIGVSNAEIFHHLNESSSKQIFSIYNIWNVKSIIKFTLKWHASYFKKLYFQRSK